MYSMVSCISLNILIAQYKATTLQFENMYKQEGMSQKRLDDHYIPRYVTTCLLPVKNACVKKNPDTQNTVGGPTSYQSCRTVWLTSLNGC